MWAGVLRRCLGVRRAFKRGGNGRVDSGYWAKAGEEEGSLSRIGGEGSGVRWGSDKPGWGITGVIDRGRAPCTAALRSLIVLLAGAGECERI